jgi:hypothetical protein
MVQDSSALPELEWADANDVVMVPLEDLHAEVQKLGQDQWAGRSAEVLDLAYRQRLLRMLGQRASKEDLNHLQDHLKRVAGWARRLTEETPARQAGEVWGARWKGFADLVDTHRVMQATRDSARVLELAHVRDIIDFVRAHSQPPLQSEIRERFKLGKANLTRILNVMEANGLIERQEIGRENRIRLGREAPEEALAKPARRTRDTPMKHLCPPRVAA